MRGRKWVLKFLKMGDSVASVVDRHSGSARGTCCIIDGGDIAPQFAGQLLGLTNDHVVSEYPEEYQFMRPMRPEDSAVRFTLSDDPDREYAIDKVLWSSPFFVARHLSVFSFTQMPPIGESDLELIDYLPPAPSKPPAEVFVISHPNPDEPSYSFQNTDLLMHDGNTRGVKTLLPGRIHYTTGTIKGSSGGVALNAKLKMIGLHHAGGDAIARIDGRGWSTRGQRSDLDCGHYQCNPPQPEGRRDEGRILDQRSPEFVGNRAIHKRQAHSYVHFIWFASSCWRFANLNITEFTLLKRFEDKFVYCFLTRELSCLFLNSFP